MSGLGIRAAITWSEIYHSEWDDHPDRYAEAQIVRWGKSRRLGKLELGPKKAYLGVQHIDPSAPGWSIVDEPETRFFVSLFTGGTCVALRTMLTMEATLDILEDFVAKGVRTS